MDRTIQIAADSEGVGGANVLEEFGAWRAGRLIENSLRPCEADGDVEREQSQYQGDIKVSSQG